jgi:DNA-binding NarL/FixJ family response regulator
MQVMVVDDSTLFRRGLVMLLRSSGITVTAECRCGGDVEEALAAGVAADVVILDIRMPPTFTDEGLRAARRLRELYPRLALLVLSTYAETAYAVEILDIGEEAIGYLLKDRVSDVAMLVDALGRLVAGETVIDPELVARLLARQRRTQALDRLTDRERAVLGLMAEGRSNAGIAAELFVQPKTVERHIATIFSQLGLEAEPRANRRVLAVLTWLRAQT